MHYNIRLCNVIKRNDFEGYGFNLHSEANRPGQFIGHIEDNSPAFQAGLLKNDILIEVNGFNVCDENHQQVVNRIKENPLSVTLLIIDSDGYNYCKNNNIEIKKDLLKTQNTNNDNELPKNAKIQEVPIEKQVTTKTISTTDSPAKTVSSKSEKSNIEDLSIDEIRAKVAESGARKRRDRNAPNSFRDRAHQFEEL